MTMKAKRILSLLLAVMIVICAFAFTSCDGSDEAATVEKQTSTATSDNAEGKIEEQGDKNVTVKVIHADGSEKSIEINTSAENLMDALKEKNLIEESSGMIDTVDGEKADYSVNESWWCITKGGEMLMTGAADTVIADGECYELTYKIGY